MEVCVAKELSLLVVAPFVCGGGGCCSCTCTDLYICTSTQCSEGLPLGDVKSRPTLGLPKGTRFEARVAGSRPGPRQHGATAARLERRLAAKKLIPNPRFLPPGYSAILCLPMSFVLPSTRAKPEVGDATRCERRSRIL